MAKAITGFGERMEGARRAEGESANAALVKVAEAMTATLAKLTEAVDAFQKAAARPIKLTMTPTLTATLQVPRSTRKITEKDAVGRYITTTETEQ